jgi:PAS domain S-box-containing protein
MQPTDATMSPESLGLDPAGPPTAAVTAPGDSEAVRQLHAVEALGRFAARPGSAATLIDDAAALLAEALDMPLAISAELSPDGRSFHLRLRHCGSLLPDPVSDGGEIASKADLSPAGRALRSGEVVFVDALQDASQLSAGVFRAQKATSALAVPLQLGEDRFGALIAADPRRRDVPQQQRLFAETIGHLASVTLAQWRTERELEAQQERISGLLDTLDSLVFTLDADWRILEANPACRRIIGYEPDEIRSCSLWELFATGEEADILQKFLEELDPENSPLGSESVLRTKSDERRHVAWSFRKLPADAAGPARCFATAVDVTEQREAEDRARRAETAAEAAKAERAQGATNGLAVGSPSESPFGVLPTPINIERRRKPRRSYPYSQRIAPVIDGRRPDPSAFLEIECNDIAAGGFSYICDQPPASDTCVVALGCPPKETFLTAQIAHVTRVEHDGHRRFLVGCNYVGRVNY